MWSGIEFSRTLKVCSVRGYVRVGKRASLVVEVPLAFRSETDETYVVYDEKKHL